MAQESSGAAAVQVPMLDLKAEHEPIKEQLRQAIDGVLDSSDFVLGEAVSRFEQEFARYCGVKDAVAVSNGTTALHAALRCCDVRPGDDVVTVSMSFIATAWPILYEGARPVFVDIDPERYTMDPKALERAITKKTRAIIVVHLYGQCADMDPILEIAKSRGIPVIEDACQAVGALYKGRRAGAMGTFGCFSFYPSKNLGGIGDGGAVTTSSAEMAKRLRELRNHAQVERYRSEELGFNYRLDSISCAALSVKLPHVDAWIDQRRAVAATYASQLAGTSLRLPEAASDGKHSYHLYVGRHASREKLQAFLKSRGVQSAVHYPTPIHRQGPFRGEAWDLPVTDELTKTCVSLPMYPELTPEQVKRVVNAVRDFQA